MAAHSNPINTGQVPELILTKKLADRIESANRPIPLWAALGRLKDCTDDSATNRQFAAWERNAGSQSESSGKTETDEYGFTVQSLSEVLIPFAKVGISSVVSDEALSDSSGDLLGGIVGELFGENVLQQDVDWLSNITSSTVTYSNAGSTTTKTDITTAGGQLRALNPNAINLACVLHEEQFTHLQLDVEQNTGSMFGGSHGDEASGLLKFKRGFMGRHAGIDYFASTNVPEFDATNWSGALMIPGRDHGAIAMCMKRSKVPRELLAQKNARDLPLNHMLTMEFEHRRDDVVAVVRGRWGTGVVNNNHLCEIVSAKAA